MRQFQLTVPEDRGGEVLRYLTTERDIKNIAKVYAGTSFMLFFRVTDGKATSILNGLQEMGVGRNWGIIDVLPMDATSPLEQADEKDQDMGTEDRLTSEAILATVEAGNRMTFDFLVYLVTSSMIAGAGLATNNPVVVVASMLVSPLMGPILALTIGILLDKKFKRRKWRMIKSGLFNEVVAVAIAVLIGVIMGLGFLWFGPSLDWPTNEMASRGVPQALLIGLLVAAPSGAGAAVAVTSGGVNSLVGVAISASLLPPAVNTGMCFSYGLVGPFVHDVSRSEFLIIAAYSFALLVLNIVVIIVVAIIFFKIKKVGVGDITSAAVFFQNFDSPTSDPDLEHGRTEQAMEVLSKLRNPENSEFSSTVLDDERDGF